jgi:hypothetical protein
MIANDHELHATFPTCAWRGTVVPLGVYGAEGWGGAASSRAGHTAQDRVSWDRWG